MKAKLLFSDMNLKRRQPFIINIGFVEATISDFSCALTQCIRPSWVMISEFNGSSFDAHHCVARHRFAR
jgi:hypothetical protein